MKKENFLSPRATREETGYIDLTLRPISLEEFVGQEKVKRNLKIFIEAAKSRRESLDHCLLYSPPGLGKTTLSHIIAKEMGVNIKTTSGPVLSKPGDLATILTTEINEGDVLFIDEVHRINAAVEEALYPAMEDFVFFVNTGKGPGSTTLKLSVPKFTLIAATTRSGLLTGPLRDRFGIIFNLGFYTRKEIEQIIARSAKILRVETTLEGIREIAKRSRGTPRIANRLLKRTRDFAQILGEGTITPEITLKTMASLDIDECGLDALDRKLLSVIIENFNGGPVGLETLAIALNEETDTLSESIEPFLMQSGFLERTPRGRKTTKKSYKHLGITPPGDLFQNA